MIKSVKKIFLLSLCLFLNSCASKVVYEDMKCPSVEEEAVSKCRAEQACKNVTSAPVSTGFSVGVGTGFGFGIGHRLPSESYAGCIHQDLQRQKEKAKDTN